jgi:hypothetical protein
VETIILEAKNLHIRELSCHVLPDLVWQTHLLGCTVNCQHRGPNQHSHCLAVERSTLYGYQSKSTEEVVTGLEYRHDFFKIKMKTKPLLISQWTSSNDAEKFINKTELKLFTKANTLSSPS